MRAYIAWSARARASADSMRAANAGSLARAAARPARSCASASLNVNNTKLSTVAGRLWSHLHAHPLWLTCLLMRAGPLCHILVLAPSASHQSGDPLRQGARPVGAHSISTSSAGEPRTPARVVEARPARKACKQQDRRYVCVQVQRFCGWRRSAIGGAPHHHKLRCNWAAVELGTPAME